MIRWLFRQVNIWVILASLFVAGLMIGIIALVIFLSPAPQLPTAPSGVMTIIPAPTITPTVLFTETPSPTPPVVVEGVTIGIYVQIAGTEGQGLRIRSGPGTGNPPRFLGMDAEVFQIKDGPVESDGFTWWYLEAPYDPSRSGWAASLYLQAIEVTPSP